MSDQFVRALVAGDHEQAAELLAPSASGLAVELDAIAKEMRRFRYRVDGAGRLESDGVIYDLVGQSRARKPRVPLILKSGWKVRLTESSGEWRVTGFEGLGGSGRMIGTVPETRRS